MERPDLSTLVRDGTLDAESAALLWLLSEGGVPIVVVGPAEASIRADVAGAIVSVDPHASFVVLDAQVEPPTADRLAALLRGGVRLGLTLGVEDLRGTLAAMTAAPISLPEDAVRRLGAVVVVGRDAHAPRVLAVHYLRPTERDGQGHVQRRPPAVLTTWDADGAAFEHFAWGITPELGDRIDRAQADLEQRQASRAAFLSRLAAAGGHPPERAAKVAAHLAAEPPRVPAPRREPAEPSPFHGGLTDPHVH